MKSVSDSSKLDTNTLPIFYTFGIPPNQSPLVCSRTSATVRVPYAPPEGIIEGSSFFVFGLCSVYWVIGLRVWGERVVRMGERGLCAWAVIGWRLAEFDSLADMLNARAIILANNLV